MANTNAPFGFRRSGTKGSPGGLSLTSYIVPAADGTALFLNDMVKLYGTADAGGLNQVIAAAAGDTLVGSVAAFVLPASVAAPTVKHRVASTKVTVLVNDDPYAVFEAQEDALGATTALADVGENCDIACDVAGSTVTGVSGMQIDSSDHKTATAQVRLLGFVQKKGNTPASAYAKMLVMINEHVYKSTTGV